MSDTHPRQRPRGNATTDAASESRSHVPLFPGASGKDFHRANLLAVATACVSFSEAVRRLHPPFCGHPLAC